MELTQQEVLAIIGEQQLQIVAQKKYIAQLEAKLKEKGAEHGAG